MTAEEFAAALERLGWSQYEAAERLRVGGGQPRVNEWVRGRRPVPPYIAAHVRTLLELHEARSEQ